MNHILGNYIGFAVNDPKHYPKKAYLEKQSSGNGFTSDEMLDAYIIANYQQQKGQNGRKN